MPGALVPAARKALTAAVVVLDQGARLSRLPQLLPDRWRRDAGQAGQRVGSEAKTPAVDPGQAVQRVQQAAQGVLVQAAVGEPLGDRRSDRIPGQRRRSVSERSDTVGVRRMARAELPPVSAAAGPWKDIRW
jgi:hypothetical protein